MPGPRPKPTKLKLLEGNAGRRPLNDDEPTGQPGVPDPPTELGAKVEEQWAKLVQYLDGMQVLTKAHGLALFALSRAAADYVAYHHIVPCGGDVLLTAGLVDEKGNVVEERKAYWNYAAAARDRAENRMVKLLIEFGLTPAAASKVKKAAIEEADPFTDFLNGKKQA